VNLRGGGTVTGRINEEGSRLRGPGRQVIGDFHSECRIDYAQPFRRGTIQPHRIQKKRISVWSCDFDTAKERIMGILEELAGAAVAVEGAKKLDPNAGIVTEGIAAVVGFEGTEAVTNLIDKKEEEKKDQQG